MPIQIRQNDAHPTGFGPRTLLSRVSDLRIQVFYDQKLEKFTAEKFTYSWAYIEDLQNYKRSLQQKRISIT
jgi:hypothetical protein